MNGRKKVSNLLDELLLIKETMWCQRSRVMNLAEGNQNTKFFHQQATRRKKRNFIKGVRDDNGEWVGDQLQVSKVAVDFFTKLFASAGPHSFEEALMGIRNWSDRLIQVKFIVRCFRCTQDGMNANFYQKHWHIVGKDVAECVIGLLNGSRNLKELNKTHVVLIPKVKNPASLAEYRPISLFNVIYKIASKVLVNRLKPFLSNIISLNQIAFTRGRLITDNTWVAFETFHYMGSVETRRYGSMAVKLDMSKAYDRVEWVIMRRIMEKMGFHVDWIRIASQLYLMQLLLMANLVSFFTGKGT